MTPPPDDDHNDNGTIDGTALYTPAHDELLRHAIREKLAKLSPEERRKWRERMVTMLTREVIVPIPGAEEDDERG